MEMLSTVAAGAGLSPLGSLGPMLVGVLLILIVVKLLSMPFKLVWNGLCGAVILWIVNLIGALVGFSLKITVIKALIAGFFGIPGAVVVVLYELLSK